MTHSRQQQPEGGQNGAQHMLALDVSGCGVRRGQRRRLRLRGLVEALCAACSSSAGGQPLMAALMGGRDRRGAKRGVLAAVAANGDLMALSSQVGGWPLTFVCGSVSPPMCA